MEAGQENLGFPQLDTHTYASQVFWLFVAFVLLYALMSRIALPRVMEVLEARRSQRDGNLEAAGVTNGEAEKIRAAYEKSLAQANKKAGETIRAAERAASEKMSEEQSRFADTARKRLVTTEQNINKAKAEALHSLADIAADIAADMAQKIADVQINKADAKKTVLAVMQED